MCSCRNNLYMITSLKVHITFGDSRSPSKCAYKNACLCIPRIPVTSEVFTFHDKTLQHEKSILNHENLYPTETYSTQYILQAMGKRQRVFKNTTNYHPPSYPTHSKTSSLQTIEGKTFLVYWQFLLIKSYFTIYHHKTYSKQQKKTHSFFPPQDILLSIWKGSFPSKLYSTYLSP